MANLSTGDVAKLIMSVGDSHGKTVSLASVALFTSIVMAESGGNPTAVNVNRKPGKVDDGSRDRGLWQWNDYWNPDITDVEAFDPVKSTEWAYTKSNGFTITAPMWTGSKGLLPDNVADARDTVVDVVTGFDKVFDTPKVDDIPGVATARSVTEFLGMLSQPHMWVRIVKVVGGVVAVVVGVGIVASDTAVGQGVASSVKAGRQVKAVGAAADAKLAAKEAADSARKVVSDAGTTA